MNQLLILGSLIFGMNIPTDTTTKVITYVDVETISHVYNHETEQVEAVLYIEQEEEIELGFDIAAYLPVGFDPYEEAPLTNDEIDALFEEEIELGFDTSKYLPDNFDPYQEENISEEEINSLFEEEIELGFNTNEYLPVGFNAYAGLNTVK